MIETVDLYIRIDTATRIIKQIAIQPSNDIDVTESEIIILSLPKIYTMSDAGTGINTYWVNDKGRKIPASEIQIESMNWATVVNPDGSRQYWMLSNDNRKTPALDADVDALGIDPHREQIKRELKLAAYKESVLILTQDITLKPAMRDYFMKLLETL